MWQGDLDIGRKLLMSGAVSTGAPFTISRASGSEVWDTFGNRYIDGTSQAWSLSVGHCHPRVIEAVIDQIKKCGQIRTSYESIPKLLLAKKLSEIIPGPLKKIAFCLSGSDGMEGAVKLAIRNRGTERSQTVVSLWDGFHGRTLGTMSMSWPHPSNPFSEWHGPVLRVPNGYCYRCPVGKEPSTCDVECVKMARSILNANLSGPPAAIVMEPFQGNGGMIEFPKKYFQKMKELVAEIGTLLVMDEIQTGMGRMGEWLASTIYDIQPDIVVIGKGLGGGFPLTAVLADEKLDGFHAGDHSFTHGHFPPSMAAALATLQVIEEEDLLQRSRKIGAGILWGLTNLQNRYDCIGDVRGVGLMLALELVHDRVTKEPAPDLAAKAVKMARERGLILGESKYGGLGNVIKFKPPLNIPMPLVDEALDILESVFRDLR